uniref:Uncharacterized protein n=1 Tax=Dichotomaria marginata TaxID=268567 RepID=A0A1G4NSG0_9FLOR|nr:Hypothetical protein ORF_18 [Dichotomaria marginata]SCW21506.1 Hypothetical protein ORF_18 [Dichotomaria marginata]
MLKAEVISSQKFCSSSFYNGIKNASATLSITSILSNYVSLPIIISSYMNSLIVKIAISFGALGIGIGSFLTSRNLICNYMLRHIKDIMYSLNTNYDEVHELSQCDSKKSYFNSVKYSLL